MSQRRRRHRKAASQSRSQFIADGRGQCDPIENFADKKVSLNGGQLFSYDLVPVVMKDLSSLPGVSSSMTIRWTDIFSLPPHTYYFAPPSRRRS